MKRAYVFIPLGLVAVVAIMMGTAQIFAPDIASGLKDEIETQGTAMIGVPVTVERIELSPVTGQGRLIGLTIGNPPGYRTVSALRLGEVEIRLDPSVLRISPLIIRAIDIRHLTVTVEGNNLATLGRNVSTYMEAAKSPPSAGASDAIGPANAESSASGSSEETAPDSVAKVDDDASAPRIIVKSVNIESGQIVIAPRLLMGATITNNLKQITLENVGAEKGGATVGELVGALVNAIMIGVGETAGQDEEDHQG